MIYLKNVFLASIGGIAAAVLIAMVTSYVGVNGSTFSTVGGLAFAIVLALYLVAGRSLKEQADG